MDHVKLYMLLEAHHRLLGLPAMKNLRSAVEGELQKIDASFAPPKTAPAPKVVPAKAFTAGPDESTGPTAPSDVEIERKL